MTLSEENFFSELIYAKLANMGMPSEELNKRFADYGFSEKDIKGAESDIEFHHILNLLAEVFSEELEERGLKAA